MRARVLVVAIGILSVGTIVAVAELPPAGEVRKKIVGDEAAAPAAPADANLRVEIDALAAKVGQMPPADAAAAWLKLVDNYAAMGPRRMSGRFGHDEERVNFASLLDALPPPAAWEDLAKAIAARPPGNDPQSQVREAGLRALASALTDGEAKKRDVEALAEALLKHDRQNYRARNLLTALNASSDSDLVKDFEETIDKWDAESGGGIEVPDLVTLVGKDRAAELLRKAILLPHVELSMEVGDETRKLARQIVLEEIDKIKSPQWELCASLDAVKLFEAMNKRFGPKDATTQEAAGGDLIKRVFSNRGDAENPWNEHEYREATSYYLLGLVVAGRADDAIAQVKKMPPEQVDLSYSALDELEEGGHGKAVQAFLHKLLSENPDLPLWDNYVALSTKGGKTDEMVALARKAAARENLDPAKQTAIRQALAKVLLAADQTEEGIAVLRETSGAAIQRARIGKLLQRQELIDGGVNAAKKEATEDNVRLLAHLLEDLGRGGEAVDALVAEVARQREGKNEQNDPNAIQRLAVELLGIYHRAGRHADVLEFLRTLPNWNGSDLVDVYQMKDTRETPVGFMAAAALADGEQKDEARKVLNATLDVEGGFDPAYELLVKLDGNPSITRLDELFARDQFQERPLIWKGIVLLADGKTDEAEKVIRQAISIDPSDGEQGKGTRMRVYSVLAEILEKQGDAKKAELFRGAVKAIRTAEDADDWWDAGLLTRAIKQYEQALTYFQDAYCIQSRLALRMAEMGFMEKAEEHYRKAYELMPDSFGRMESHCFGCEGAFKGKTARHIAEDVFTRLVKAEPKKPQLHYLLGYLREQQGAYKEAVEPYQTAVKLDPDYINAWKHLRDLGSHVHLAPEIRESASLNVMRLDPLGRHSSINVSNVRDLKKLYETASRSAALRVQPPKSLMPLPAAAEKQAKKALVMDRRQVFSSNYRGNQEPRTPGGVVAKTDLITAIASVLDVY